MTKRTGQATRPLRRLAVVFAVLSSVLAVTGLAACTDDKGAEGDASATTALSSPPASASASPTIVGTARPVALTGPQPGWVSSWLDRDEAKQGVPTGDPALYSVLIDLRQRVLTMAGAVGELNARCENDRINLTPGAVTQCSTVYNGLEMVWAVTVSRDSPPNSMFVSYRVSPPPVVLLTAANVYQLFWRTTAANTMKTIDDPRCDEIPASVLVTRGTPYENADTGYRCQFLGGAVGDPVRRRVDQRVMVRDTGSVTFS
ncbi:hypothetical protein LO772_30875 [Yinghuangia sp. ASG 101]|uniref:hypothetical protein n=1 Tax=Yinghuangia sp. ASG 101 TaxID=2896848 RepID=UPI001E29400E|nr:hypothetical protein [Yinghuangia sp. ASG 101]UGQ11160.1 hypothetical protein LO772_30875 [Yinghuangia sp. ASG 101]